MDPDQFKHFPGDHQHMPDTVLCTSNQMTSKWSLPSGCPQDGAVGRLQVCLCPVAWFSLWSIQGGSMREVPHKLS